MFCRLRIIPGKTALEVRPTTLAVINCMTLTASELQRWVMTYSQAKVQSQRSVGSENRVQTNGRTDITCDINAVSNNVHAVYIYDKIHFHTVYIPTLKHSTPCPETGATAVLLLMLPQW